MDNSLLKQILHQYEEKRTKYILERSEERRVGKECS